MLVISGQSRKMYLRLKARRKGAIFSKRSLPQRGDKLSPRLIGVSLHRQFIHTIGAWVSHQM